jgi:hypothetical protein
MQSSPGYLHVGHVPSKWTWQIPQTSSSGISHRQIATAFHILNLTFILTAPPSVLGRSGLVVRFLGWRRKVEVGDVYFTTSRLAIAPIKRIFTCRAVSYQQLRSVAPEPLTTHTANLRATPTPLPLSGNFLLSFVFRPASRTSTASSFLLRTPAVQSKLYN